MKTLEKKPFNGLNSYTKKILFCFIVLFLIALPVFQLNAANPALKSAQEGLINSAHNAGLTEQTDVIDGSGKTEVRNMITKIIGYTLSMIGVFFLILIIISGYQWMSAGGNEETIGKAKKRIINATIGLAIVLMAYAISYFAIYMISEQTLTAIEG